MNVSATSRPIAVTVTGAGQISASVQAVVVSASASGGVGPQGPQGVSGPPGSALSSAGDVALTSVQDGDLLRFSNAKWRNSPESVLPVDGGNF